MSKRKTKQEKIITDLHRKLHAQSQSAPSSRHVSSPSSTYTYKSRNIDSSPNVITSSTNLSYIKHDLLKTTIVTSTIVLSQLLLLYLLRSHIIMIPMVRY